MEIHNSYPADNHSIYNFLKHQQKQNFFQQNF